MEFRRTDIDGVVIVVPDVHGDDRGFFLETWHAERYAAGGIPHEFVQDNHSKSAGGVLRGLHLQVRRPQGKLVRVLAGRVYDVAVDVRLDSPTFGRSVAVELDAVQHWQLFVPPGFAHGFQVLSQSAEVAYKCTDYYHPESELSIRWDDPDLGIRWPNATPRLSTKDAAGVTLAEAREILANARQD